MDSDLFDLSQSVDFDISNYITTPAAVNADSNKSSDNSNLTPDPTLVDGNGSISDLSSSSNANSPTSLPPEPPKGNLLRGHTSTYSRGRHNKDNCLFITPEKLSDILTTDQNKLIHLSQLPDFKERSEIKPWLQRIFFPQGVDIVIERSDRNKVIFKCKGTVASTASACPFRIRATYSLKLKRWNIVIMNNTHTHPCQFNPASEEYKKFKNYMRKIGDIDTIKRFEEMEYRAKHELPVVPLLISCDCGLTTEINWFDVVLPAPKIINPKKVTKPGRKTSSVSLKALGEPKRCPAALVTPSSFAGDVESPSCLDFGSAVGGFDNSLGLDSDGSSSNSSSRCSSNSNNNSNDFGSNSVCLNMDVPPMTVTPTTVDKSYNSENEIDFTDMFKKLKKHHKSTTGRLKDKESQTKVVTQPETSSDRSTSDENAPNQLELSSDPTLGSLDDPSNGTGYNLKENEVIFDDSELTELLRQFEGYDDNLNAPGLPPPVNTDNTDPFTDLSLFNFCS